MNHLVLKNVRKSYKNRIILNNISFECQTNEILAFFGRNGSGKSSLLKMIYGTLGADHIELFINDKPFLPAEIIRNQNIAYLPQDSFLPKSLSVSNAISMYFPNGDDQDKIFYAPRIYNIQHKKAGNLSLGELRYLEILLVSNLSHEFLMLDEPFSMIEPLYIELIKNHLLALKEKKGIILTDHYYKDALEIADKNFLIKDGNKIIINDRSDLITHNYLIS